MATTSYGVNDTLAVKLWAKKLAVEALKATPIAPLIGTSSDSVIHLKSELSKGAGDKITFGLRTQLQGEGVTEGEILEGNEESLSTYADALVINELAHAVRVRNKGTIDQKRVPFNLRDEAKSGLRDWYAKRMSVSFFNQVCGYTPETRVKFTGLQAPVAPHSTRKIICESGVTDEGSITSAGKMKLVWLDYAKELAKTSDVPIRPLMIGGEEKYVVYLHPYQVTDLRTDASTAGNWFDIQKAAMQGGKVSNNPIYTGALGEYNGVILREAFDVTLGVTNAGASKSDVRRAVFMGAQAAAMGFAEGADADSFNWVEDLFDYERELGVSAQTIFGVKKTMFNSVDFGTIVLPSYAAKHTS
jgi:N4-gp56 family major capsid protein